MLVDVVRAQGEDEAEEAVAGLLDTGSLVEVGSGALAPETFARGHRFQPLLLGLGVTLERPDQYRIGVFGETVAIVDDMTFDMWELSPRVASLWKLSEVHAVAARALGDDAGEKLDQLLWRLHVLLAFGCGYLDIAPPDASST